MRFKKKSKFFQKNRVKKIASKAIVYTICPHKAIVYTRQKEAFFLPSFAFGESPQTPSYFYEFITFADLR